VPGAIGTNRIGGLLAKAGILWAFLGLFIILSILSPAFITPNNLMNVIKQMSVNGIMGIAMTFVLILGGIDLSVGSLIALTSVCAAFFARQSLDLPLIVPIAVSLLVGVAAGAINGFGIAYVGISPFIMTLAMMSCLRGLAQVLSNGSPIFGLSKPFNGIANGFVLGIPNLVYFLLVILVIGIFVLRKTVFGKWVYAIGGNEVSARLSGINTRWIKVVVYMGSGLLAGVCGVLMASRITSGSPIIGVGYELNAISAAVIGGVSMSGGTGNLLGTLIGALIIGVIQNGLDILGVSAFYQQIIQGLIIMVAVFLDIKSKSRI
jgi:ribose/xylose/arabinose/galactoside ABC-type transport system permease subunit